jgi:L-ascorbate metabolism protein UlaG (beta-lactamase superfamily)
MANGVLTWLGHGSFRFDSPGGLRVYVDPWLEANPSCPAHEREPERMDAMLLTHGHTDHAGEAVSLWQRYRPRVIAQGELRGWLESLGVEDDGTGGPNKGGTAFVEGIAVTLTDANHSSSGPEGQYLGEPTGLVVTLEDDRVVYFAGDTNVFGDMALIGRIYRPDVACLPIGDHYTMGPREAAVAIELLGADRVVPCHYGTFPVLHGTAEALLELTGQDAGVVVLEPGGSLEL